MAASSQQRTVITIAAALVAVVLGYFVYERTRNPCESIFEQATTNLGAKLEVIRAKGEVYIGRQKVQELSDKSQQMALNLKTCCIVLQGGKLDSGEFLQCKQEVAQHESRVTQVAAFLSQAQAAEAQGQKDVVRVKSDAASRIADQANSGAAGFMERVARLQVRAPAEATSATGSRSVAGGGEQEPNNTVLQFNEGELGAALNGEIAPAKDSDYYRFQYRDPRKRRDIVAVHLENLSTTLQPALRLHNDDKSVARDWFAANAPGADLGFSFSAEPDRAYFVAVGSQYGDSLGKYRLTVTPQKAGDSFEPNDDGFSATPLAVGKTLEANIMDGADVDWYRLSGVIAKAATARVENKSRGLQPVVRIHNADKSVARDWTAANAPGADLEVSFPAEPGKEYFVVVGARYGNSAGAYRLTLASGSQ